VRECGCVGVGGWVGGWVCKCLHMDVFSFMCVSGVCVSVDWGLGGWLGA